MIRTKHLREPFEPFDGTRIYVGRRYPRGVQDNTLWHERIHDLGPSLGLHRAVLHEGLSADEYDRRFLCELEQPRQQALIRRLAERSFKGEVLTLLCDHPRALPAERCHRFALKRLIEAVDAG